MKHKLAVFGMVGFSALLLSAFTPEQKKDEPQEPKKERHIKMVKVENGKKVELDTVLTDDKIFVWHGDTIGGKEMVKHFGTEGHRKMKRYKVKVDGDGKNENVFVYHMKDGKGGEPMIWQMDSDNDVHVFTDADGDSIRKNIIIRKRIKDGEGKQMMFFDHANGMPVPPVPPVPPVAHFRSLREMNHGRVIDLNDPNIITYKKKDLKGGREKIEIIRKKSDGNLTFNFKAGDDMAMLPMPEGPEFNWAPDSAVENMTIAKEDKSVDDKKVKEIEVEVQNEENK
ncbi:MAG: hypothetical protein WC384_04940 [Prolixibacteraceae bacterium]|jgi:hypothetical protein